ncbi:hypothetical protein [uncultured Marivita sp.]|uniref:hypothetical protein n=1 Tax=uncultured Marivita sp. TaxID=888080 RepID=UPI002629C4D5|nr:hypothetical protein [uncultured Marivita sp.]
MSEKKAQVVIADVVDFYRQWPELRERAEQLVETREMAQEDAELLHWMIKMVDMVGPNDIIREK